MCVVAVGRIGPPLLRVKTAVKCIWYHCGVCVCVLLASIKLILHFKTDSLLFGKCFINDSKFFIF